MNINDIKQVYLIGIGGIGMSALARFFNERDVVVSGYDKTPTELTQQLIKEGIDIHYTDDVNLLNKAADLVIYTPAIPKDLKELNWYREQDYKIMKRSEVLGVISKEMQTIAVAGTHGKTTISSLIAHILRSSGLGCNAFLGGLTVNYETNYWSADNNITVIEADEYDRSFLQLSPDVAVLTAMDADHLDIYGNIESLEEAFIQFTQKIKPKGNLWFKHGLKRAAEFGGDNKKSYSLQNNNANAYADNVIIKDGGYIFDVFGDGWMMSQLRLNIGGMHNVENAVVAIAVAKQFELDDFQIVNAVTSFKGVKRRFEYLVKNKKLVYIDDYAHHPEELSGLIKSAKTLFRKRKCVVVFQPHLYTRTRDLADGFARSLDMADEVILLDIYPARELPIEGVSSKIIAHKMGNPNVTILTKEGLIEYVKNAPIELLITAGAGDIDLLTKEIQEILQNR